MSVAIAPSLHPVDMHVHVLGNGKSGSGCRITPRWWQRPFIDMMAANVGLKTSPATRRLINSTSSDCWPGSRNRRSSSAVILSLR